MQNSNCRALKMSSCEFRYLWGWASWKHEWCIPMSRCNSEVPRKAEALSSNRSGCRQIVVTAVPLSIRPPMTQPFVFCLLAHLTPPFLWAWVLHSCKLSNTFPPQWRFSHALIHLPGIDLKLREVTSGKHLSYFKRHYYSFWAILACQTQQAKQKCSVLLHICLWCVWCTCPAFLNPKDSVWCQQNPAGQQGPGCSGGQRHLTWFSSCSSKNHSIRTTSQTHWMF